MRHQVLDVYKRQVWKGFGYTLTVLSAAALGVSHSLYEAAELDGAGGFQQFLYVTIPGIRDTIGFCTVTTLIMACLLYTSNFFLPDPLLSYLFHAMPFPIF